MSLGDGRILSFSNYSVCWSPLVFVGAREHPTPYLRTGPISAHA
jgi:hypothetical protein